jgi:plasmid maintenance system antidote protein VapI
MGQLRNPHPGEILKEEFLKEIGLTTDGHSRENDRIWGDSRSL